jgi:hypothetical protein
MDLQSLRHSWRRARYRVEQFAASLWQKATVEELDQAATRLPPAGAALFWRMAGRDQRHSLAVCNRLCQAGHEHPDLLAAALLHDVAKTAQPGRRLRIGHRVLIVLMEAIHPGWVAQVAGEDPTGWRYPFYVHLHHPEQGARLAEEAGCSQLTVALIRRHQSKLSAAPIGEEEQLLAWLQAADDES